MRNVFRLMSSLHNLCLPWNCRRRIREIGRRGRTRMVQRSQRRTSGPLPGQLRRNCRLKKKEEATDVVIIIILWSSSLLHTFWSLNKPNQQKASPSKDKKKEDKILFRFFFSISLIPDVILNYPIYESVSLSSPHVHVSLCLGLSSTKSNIAPVRQCVEMCRVCVCACACQMMIVVPVIFSCLLQVTGRRDSGDRH